MKFIIKIVFSIGFIAICHIICHVLDVEFYKWTLAIGWWSCLVYQRVELHINKKE